MTATWLAKTIMKQWEVIPVSPDMEIGTSQEIFRHQRFVQATPEERQRIMLESSQKKYDEELGYPWDHYFGMDLSTLLQDKVALDLGCFNGGRGVAWCERYRLARLIGVDVAPTFIEAANQFAVARGARAQFQIAKGERLPLESDSVDAVLSFDVLEHVQDVQQTLKECFRVLRPGGRLFIVFPGYYQPIEHHLAFVTRLPGIQYFFSGATLTRAYFEILQERGENARWYRRSSAVLEPWERGNTINGTTLWAFRKHIASMEWKVLRHSRRPIGSIGRNLSKKPAYRLMAALFWPLTWVPGLQEILLHRITYILEKPVSAGS